jgi:hypothetical protein
MKKKVRNRFSPRDKVERGVLKEAYAWAQPKIGSDRIKTLENVSGITFLGGTTE